MALVLSTDCHSLKVGYFVLPDTINWTNVLFLHIAAKFKKEFRNVFRCSSRDCSKSSQGRMLVYQRTHITQSSDSPNNGASIWLTAYRGSLCALRVRSARATTWRLDLKKNLAKVTESQLWVEVPTELDWQLSNLRKSRCYFRMRPGVLIRGIQFIKQCCLALFLIFHVDVCIVQQNSF